MDVHSHEHVHEQKKWKEYVFQFFMLFLAVLCSAKKTIEMLEENSLPAKMFSCAPGAQSMTVGDFDLCSCSKREVLKLSLKSIIPRLPIIIR